MGMTTIGVQCASAIGNFIIEVLFGFWDLCDEYLTHLMCIGVLSTIVLLFSCGLTYWWKNRYDNCSVCTVCKKKRLRKQRYIKTVIQPYEIEREEWTFKRGDNEVEVEEVLLERVEDNEFEPAFVHNNNRYY